MKNTVKSLLYSIQSLALAKLANQPYRFIRHLEEAVVEDTATARSSILMHSFLIACDWSQPWLKS